MSQHSRSNMFVEAARWLQLSGDSEGARRLYERALQLDPDNVRALEQLVGPSSASESLAAEASALLDLMPPAPAALPEPARPAPLFTAWELEGAPGVELRDGRGACGDALDVLVGEALAPRFDEQAPVPEMPAFAPTPPPSALHTLLEGARARLQLDDFSGALELLARARLLAPTEPRVQALEARAERTLVAMLESKLGDMRAVPRLRLRPGELQWLELCPDSRRVLARVDGRASYGELFEASGLSRLGAARILARLVREGVIAVDGPARGG